MWSLWVTEAVTCPQGCQSCPCCLHIRYNSTSHHCGPNSPAASSAHILLYAHTQITAYSTRNVPAVTRTQAPLDSVAHLCPHAVTSGPNTKREKKAITKLGNITSGNSVGISTSFSAVSMHSVRQGESAPHPHPTEKVACRWGTEMLHLENSVDKLKEKRLLCALWEPPANTLASFEP